MTQDFLADPIAGDFAVTTTVGDRQKVIDHSSALAHDHVGVVLFERVFGLEALAKLRRQFADRGFDIVNLLFGNRYGDQIRVREVAIVRSVFLFALRDGFLFRIVPAKRSLGRVVDCFAVLLPIMKLSSRFVGQGSFGVAKAV